MQNNQDFKNFLTSLLKRGKIRDSVIETLLTPENLEEFKIAFTHPSAGAPRDYQLYEFLGDVVVNEFVPFYLRWRFPKIVSVKWITRLKHTLISKKFLAKLAREQGIDSHAIYGDAPFSDSEGRSLIGMRKEIELNPDLDSNMHYLNMMEDIMEAFFGCLVTITENSGKLHGVAIEISRNILRSFFDPIDIPHRYEDVFDPVSRLKELYESRVRGYKWPNDQAYKFEKIEYPDGTFKFKAVVYGWPAGDKTVKPENKVELATAMSISTNKDDAKQKAAQKALQVLDVTWNIKENQLNPHEK
jgi:dsRNA-specific ribonuclease